MRHTLALIACLTSTATFAPAAFAQPAPTQPTDAPRAPAEPATGFDDEGEFEIVVSGQRPRGSVIGDVEPEVTFNGGDIRALGVSSINDLLTELGPQLTSARGGQPVVLLEGRRISSFREIATLPAEAIARAEILPEEVALKYGYPADQKVLNIVLRQRFKAVTAELKDRLTTAGDANRVDAQLGLLTIRRDHRLNLNAAYQQADMLTEAQRGITAEATGSATGRSLQPSDESLTVSATYARTFSEKVSGSLNGELVTDRGFALSGLSPAPGFDQFSRTVDDLSLHLGSTLNAEVGKWHATLTGTYDHDDNRTISVRNGVELARSATDGAAADLTLNGNLYRLPAGAVSLTARLGGTYDAFQSETGPTPVTPGPELNRTTGIGSLNFDVPLIKSPSPFIGRLSVNGNATHRQLSDFGGLTSYGVGFTWVPGPVLRVIGSFARSETAPTMQQLGNPQIATPLVPIFDFTRGESVLATRVTGGNPDLQSARRREWSLGATIKPFTGKDLTLTASYTRSRTDRGIMALSGLTAATEAAFPSRFVRDGNGDLIQIDTTPVNIARQDSGTLRWGISFSKTLKMPQAQIDALRAEFERRRAEREAAGEAQPGGGRPRGGGGFGPGPGGRGFGGRGGGGGTGGGGGRLTFALYHTWHLTETARLADGQPEIDLLDGGSIGGRSGQPRHEVELQAGYSKSGIGLRLTGQWESASRVLDPSGTPAADLRFEDLATFNLRAFVTPSQLPGMRGKHPWMRGLRVSLAVNNILNTRQKVTDGTGATPYAYRPAFVDPLGRTVLIGVRKVFF